MLRALPFLLVVVLVACSPGSAPDAEQSPAPASAASEAAQPAAPAGPPGAPPEGSALSAGNAAAPVVKPVPTALPDVVASVNGDEIRRDELETAIRRLEGQAGAPVPATERDRIYRGVLDDLIAYRLLLQESRTRKIAVPDAEVTAQFESVRSGFPTEQAFASMLAQQQLTPEQMRLEMRNELTINRLLEAEIAPKIAVDEPEIAAFYKDNPSEFQLPPSVRASHILIAAPKEAGVAARAAALEKSAGLLKRARAGEDFAALAKEFSQDPGSAVNGGDLGLLQPGMTVGPFETAAFALAPGAISDVVETEFGYHIIKVVEKQASRSVTLDEARESIKQHLEQLSRQEHARSFVKGLRSKGAVNVFI